MSKSRPGSCWGWSWCGESSMVKLCQSGRTEIPLLPMILCLTVPLWAAFSLCPVPVSFLAPWDFSCDFMSTSAKSGLPWAAFLRRCWALQPGHHHPSWGVAGTAVPEPARGPCARCDLICGAVLYTGRPKLHTVLQVGAAGASWREAAACSELALSSTWGSEIWNPQESKQVLLWEPGF